MSSLYASRGCAGGSCTVGGGGSSSLGSKFKRSCKDGSCGSGGKSMGGSSGNKIPEGFEYGQINQWEPEQWKLFRELFSHADPSSFLGKLAAGDESTFGQMEAPAIQRFGALQGQLASRFSGMGMGGRQGSGFQNASAQATQDFAGQLASNRHDIQRQAILDLMGVGESLLGQRPYDKFLTEKPQQQQQKKQGFFEQLMGGLFGGGGGGLFGGITNLFGMG